jgi:hypothetical protein
MTARELSLVATAILTGVMIGMLWDRAGVGTMLALAVLIGGGCALAERWWTGGWR